MNPVIQHIEDRIALRELVDTFSNLADEKNVKEQLPLFTEDAELISYNDGKEVSRFKGREAIGNAFTRYLANFNTVYHINGQQTLQFNETGNAAEGIVYCQVALVSEKGGKRIVENRSVRYQDSYIKTGGRWYIKQRKSFFVLNETRPLAN